MRQTNKTGGTVLGTLVRGVLALMLGMGLLCAHATPARALSAPADKPAATRGKATDKGSAKKGKTGKTSKKDKASAKPYKARLIPSDAFASEDYDVPRSLKACIEKYGKDAITTQGYKRMFKLPGTEITVTYYGDNEDLYPLWVEGPLHALVSGISEDESVAFVDLAKGFSSMKGSFDLAADNKDAVLVCGGNVVLGQRGIKSFKDYATFTGEDGICFKESEEPVDMARQAPLMLWVKIKDGKVSGKSQAALHYAVEG